MTITAIYAGAREPDTAGLTIGGVSYWCFVWLAGAAGTGGARVEAKVFAEGEDGQMVLIDAAVVATPQGDFVDCPRVLGIGREDGTARFCVHWIDADPNETSYDLHRSLFDVTDIASGWAAQGSVSLHETLQYDHAVVTDGGDGGFIVARRTAAGTISTVRYLSPWTWGDTDWTVAEAGLTIADTVLACHANETDDVVLVSYQDTLTLRTMRFDMGGVVDGNQETFPDVLDGDNHFTAVGHVRVGADAYLVVAEVVPDEQATGGDPYNHLRLVAWRQVAGATAAPQHESQWCMNLNLLSRPWSWTSGTVGQTEAYVAVSFKSVADGQEFDQQYGYVVRLDVAALAGANAAGTIRPIICSAIMGGSIDARPHGDSPGAAVISTGVRFNHLSHAHGPPQYTLGPNVATKLFACTRWGRLKASDDSDGAELQPVEAGIGWVRFHHEPAWTVRRDAAQPTQPDTPAWKGVSKGMCLPVETPAGLVLTGGVTQAYDGEQLIELGFPWAPEIVAAEPTAMGGAMDDAETYYWFVNWVWVDARGGIHRSGPSRPVSAAVVVGGFATLTVRCLNLSLKDDRTRYPLGAPIAIEVWRTYVADGALSTDSTGVYLFRSEFGGAIANWQLQDTPNNDPSEFTIDIIVGRANSVVGLNQLAPYQLDLATLQWTPPPPVPHQPLALACLWQRRLFGYDVENRSIVWSEEILPLGSRYEWPRFLDTNTWRLDSEGEATAMLPMDDALVIYTRDAIFALTGDPGAGGSGPSMSLQTIARGIGCIEPRSLVAYTEGQFFQSAKGLHRLSRGQGVDYPGAAVEDLVRAAGNVRGAVHLEDTHQITFPLQAAPGTGPLEVRPRLAVYDYRVGKWATRTLPMLAQSSTASRLNETAHAIAWRGRQGESSLAVLEQGGLAIQRSRNDTVYADVSASGSAPVCLDITTEWFHPAGIVGQWLCDQVSLQTERTHAGPLTIHAWFNVTGVFDGTYNAASPHWTATYASAPAFMPLRFNILKLSWVKLRIFEPGTAPSTENVRLVSLTVHWRALPRARTVARV